MSTSRDPLYRRHCFPPELISYVWLYFRFPMSLRKVEQMLVERGVCVSYETARQCGLWRAVNQKAFVLDILVQRRRDSRAAQQILLNDVVEIFALPHASLAPEFSVSLHLRRRTQVSRGFCQARGCAYSRHAAAQAPCERTAWRRPYPAAPTERNRSSALGYRLPDRDRSNVPSPERRPRPRARSRCTSRRCGRIRFSSSPA